MISLDFLGETNHILDENSEVERNPFLCFRHKIWQILIEIKHIYCLGDMLSVTLAIMTVVLYVLIVSAETNCVINGNKENFHFTVSLSNYSMQFYA